MAVMEKKKRQPDVALSMMRCRRLTETEEMRKSESFE
jgi:hypothetical protein